LSDVGGGADRNDDVVEGGSVGRRVIGVRALTLFDHVALVARFLARLTVTNTNAHSMHIIHGLIRGTLYNADFVARFSAIVSP